MPCIHHKHLIVHESASGTTVTTVGPTITDSNLNKWSLVRSSLNGLRVMHNGVVDQSTSNIQELAYVNHEVYYKSTLGNWFEHLNHSWAPGSDPLTSVTSPTPPPQAVAVGYTTATFDDEFTDPNDVSSTNTGLHNWYTYNGFDPRNQYGDNMTSSDYTISNGVLTILNSHNYPGLNTIDTNHPAISTPTLHAMNTGNGLAFMYGYFEASIKFDPSPGSLGPSGAWPSFWASAVQALNGINPYAEIDFMEAYPTPSNNPPVTMSGTVHQWVTGQSNYQNTNNSFNLPTNTKLNDFNTYGCLWTPTSITWYVNNQKMMSVPTTTPTSVSSSTGATGNTFTTANTSQMYLQLGTGKNWPMQVNWVHVWQ